VDIIQKILLLVSCLLCFAFVFSFFFSRKTYRAKVLDRIEGFQELDESSLISHFCYAV